MKKRIRKKQSRPMARLLTIIFFSSGFKPKQQVKAYNNFQKKLNKEPLKQNPILIYSHSTQKIVERISTSAQLEHLFSYYDNMITSWVDNHRWSKINKFLRRQPLQMLATNAVLASYMPLPQK